MEENYDKGYGKRPLWQWLLIYLVVGGVIYTLVYYFVFAGRKSGTDSDQTQTQNSSFPY